MKLFSTWKDSIFSHPDKSELNLRMEDFPSLIPPGTFIDDGFQILESSPSSVLITFDPVSNEIVPSFYHTSVGNELVDRNLWKIGLTGFTNIASPISFGADVFTGFKFKITPPTFKDFIDQGAEAITTDQQKKGALSFKRYAILPPIIADAIMSEDLSPFNVLSNIINILLEQSDLIDDYLQEICLRNHLSSDSSTDEPPSFDDVKDKHLFNAFYDILVFLWSVQQDSLKDKFPSVVSPIMNKPKVTAKVDSIHATCIENTTNKNAESPLTLTKLEPMLKKFVSSAVENSSAAKLSLSEEDQIPKKVKGFNSLGEKIKQTLLKIASDGISIPSTPSDSLQEILSAKSGPNDAYLMSQWHINEDFMISRGMAHNLGHGNIFSTDPTIIDNASIFFVSLKSAKSVKMVDQN